jgi:cell division cycle 2-like protein
MDKIFKLVGTPTEENWPDFDKLPSAGIFRWKSKTGGPQLSSAFPVNSPSGGQAFLDGNGFDLLSKLLTLDPRKRITAEQALNHSYFCEGVEMQVPTFFFNDS